MADYAIHDTTLEAIANTIRKKDGTQALIDPADYADRINLMGMLEIKSASGAIASFSDGADGVPVKSCSVSFVASGGGGTPQNPISVVGVSGLSVTRTGKNLVNGYTDYNVMNKMIEPVFLKAGNYTVSFQRSAVVQGIYVRKGDTVSLVGDAYAYKYNSTFFAFNADVDGYYFIQLYRSANSATWEEAPISNVQLEVGSTATTYEAYVTPSVVTDTFGQTIYGGTRDLTTDKASVTIAKYQITSFSGTWGAVTNGYGYYVSVADTTHNTAVVIPSGMLANHSFTYGSLGRSQAPTWQYGGNDGGTSVQTFILPSEYDTLTKANQWLTNNPLEVTLTLATPTEITGLTPHEIDTLYGDNNIYADTGTMEVEYRSSGTVYQYPAGEGVSF